MTLNQITIYSNQVQKSIQFYTDLGLELIVDSAPRYVRFICPDQSTTFSIHEKAEATISPDIVLYFECDNVDEEVARLKRLNYEFEREVTDQPWMWREALLKDPNGNSIILYHAGDMRVNPPWKVKIQ